MLSSNSLSTSCTFKAADTPDAAVSSTATSEPGGDSASGVELSPPFCVIFTISEKAEFSMIALVKGTKHRAVKPKIGNKEPCNRIPEI